MLAILAGIQDLLGYRPSAKRGHKPVLDKPIIPAHSNPPLTPTAVVLQFTPANHLHRFGKHRFEFHLFNWVGRQLGLYHPADQKVFLLGHGFQGGPFAQQPFLGWRGFVACIELPAPPLRQNRSPPWRSSRSSFSGSRPYVFSMPSK